MEELILKMAELIKERNDLLNDSDEWAQMLDERAADLAAAQIAHAELVEGVVGVLYDDLDRGSKDRIRQKLRGLIDGK